MTTIAFPDLPPTTEPSCVPTQPWPMPNGWPFSGEFPMPSMPGIPGLPMADPPVTAYSPVVGGSDPL